MFSRDIFLPSLPALKERERAYNPLPRSPLAASTPSNNRLSLPSYALDTKELTSTYFGSTAELTPNSVSEMTPTRDLAFDFTATSFVSSTSFDYIPPSFATRDRIKRTPDKNRRVSEIVKKKTPEPPDKNRRNSECITGDWRGPEQSLRHFGSNTRNPRRSPESYERPESISPDSLSLPRTPGSLVSPRRSPDPAERRSPLRRSPDSLDRFSPLRGSPDSEEGRSPLRNSPDSLQRRSLLRNSPDSEERRSPLRRSPDSVRSDSPESLKRYSAPVSNVWHFSKYSDSTPSTPTTPITPK